MKRYIYTTVWVLALGFILTACGSMRGTDARQVVPSPAQQTSGDNKNFDYFKKAFEESGYSLEREDKPMFSLIQATDGILYYVGNDVLKIYQYKDEAAYAKAAEASPIVKDMAKNGFFIAESSSKDLLAFFENIKLQ